jgi:hypothetical protein
MGGSRTSSALFILDIWVRNGYSGCTTPIWGASSSALADGSTKQSAGSIPGDLHLPADLSPGLLFLLETEGILAKLCKLIPRQAH